MAYLLSCDDDLSVYRKNEVITDLRNAFGERRFSDCISMIGSIGSVDDELAYILAYSYFELGISYAKNGSFNLILYFVPSYC
jgi:hypothetical protein